jgi:hypothetical protein
MADAQQILTYPCIRSRLHHFKKNGSRSSSFASMVKNFWVAFAFTIFCSVNFAKKSSAHFQTKLDRFYFIIEINLISLAARVSRICEWSLRNEQIKRRIGPEIFAPYL